MRGPVRGPSHRCKQRNHGHWRHGSVVSVQLACTVHGAGLLIIRRSWVRAPPAPPNLSCGDVILSASCDPVVGTLSGSDGRRKYACGHGAVFPASRISALWRIAVARASVQNWTVCVPLCSSQVAGLSSSGSPAARLGCAALANGWTRLSVPGTEAPGDDGRQMPLDTLLWSPRLQRGWLAGRRRRHAR
jgi:hypothetical protein